MLFEGGEPAAGAGLSFRLDGGEERPFLAAAAQEDGVVEITGQVRDAIALQGWGGTVEAETTAILGGKRVACAPVTTASFARPDIAAPCTGLVHLVSLGSERASLTAPALHLAAGRRLLRRTVLAGFLAAPTAEDEALLIVLGPEWQGAPLDALEAALHFYRLEAGILIAEEEPEATEARELAARPVAAERFLCLAAPPLVGPPGWRRALAQRLMGGDTAPPRSSSTRTDRCAASASIRSHRSPPRPTSGFRVAAPVFRRAWSGVGRRGRASPPPSAVRWWLAVPARWRVALPPRG